MTARAQRFGLAFAALVTVAGCTTTGASSSDSASSIASSRMPSPSVSASVSKEASSSAMPGGAPDATAINVLDTLPVKGRAPKTGYTRDQFGPAWKDMNHNGCDTRNDILQRDLTKKTFKNGSKCVVATGTLVTDPYTGKTIVWTRGQNTSSAIQIDHVVALSNAWQTGAQQWSAQKRETFGNDPLNLIAADGPANMAKGDGDAATWLPPNKAYRCQYVENQIAVKKKYGLWVTAAEKNAMNNILQNCPNAPLPSGGIPVPK